MVNRLERPQGATENSLHHCAMLNYTNATGFVDYIPTLSAVPVAYAVVAAKLTVLAATLNVAGPMPTALSLNSRPCSPEFRGLT